MKSRVILALAAASSLYMSCTTSDDDKGPSTDLKQKAVANYADIVYNSYVDARDAGVKLKSAIDDFIANPSDATQDSAKKAWLASRIPYGQTEVYRFYDGPIDNATDGPEPLLNSWPLDEANIDYVFDKEGDSTIYGGIINATDEFPEITVKVLADANGSGGEDDITTGYHAIEFLLWGQDLEAPDQKTPGQRPYTDYVVGEDGTGTHQARRATYLKLAAGLLVDNLNQLVDAWKPGAANYRKTFVAANPDSSLAKILTGMGSLGGAELSGERMTVALNSHDQEDEHSCFSDNTHMDVILNDQGISNVFNGSYLKTNGVWITGTSLYDVIKAADAALAETLKTEMAASLADAHAIEPPFDLAISGDNETGRKTVKTTVDALREQTTTLAKAAKALGITLNIE